MSESLLGSETVQKVLTKDSACPSLPVKYRIIGFISCLVIGFAISLLSSFLLMFSAVFKPYKFAILFTFGNLNSLASSFFLVGPCRQLKSMFDKKRIIATILALASMIFTLIYSLVIYNPEKGFHKIIIWILVALQYVAIFWYLLSYIPFGRTLCKKCVGCMCKCDK